MQRLFVVTALVGVLIAIVLSGRRPTAATSPTAPKSDQPSAQPSGYVLQWDEGDKMILGRRHAPLNIKVSPKTGSQHLIMGTK
jgi:hypothetical protein